MTTLLTITTAVFAGCAVALGWRWQLKKRNRELVAEIKEQKEKIAAYQASAKDTKADYFVGLIDNKDICVYRHTINGRYAFRQCIKVFTDPDQDFNRREAEELVEKLNEK